ncbi:MAG TPA: alpha/beta fold hydrolase [Candidatus Dormibacteraeota bacterium]|nr:alpha/beta fold hydrolase [Candidatus Dormibacteraeota bacterium]
MAGTAITAGERHVSVDGLRLRVRVQGHGPPLLLVMGLGGNLEMWGPLVDELAGFTTIAFDAPGTGDSEIPWRPLRMHELADTTAHLLDALGCPNADVIGVSFGGAVAQELVHRHPDRVRRLVLAATTCGFGGIPGKPSALALLSTPYRYYSRSHMRAIAARLYGGEIARRPELLERHAYEMLAHAPSARGYLWQMSAIVGWSSLLYLHRIRQPVLVMTGDDDPIIRVVNGRILALLIPNARLHVLGGGGHLFLIDQPKESAELIRRFLVGAEQGADGRPA